MARHQVLQHRLGSCTSAIPHPFCQRHPKIKSRVSLGIARPGAAAIPRPPCRAGSAFSRSPRPAPADALRRYTTHPRSQQPDPHTETSISIDKFFDMVSFHPSCSAATEQLQLQRGQSHHNPSPRCRSTTPTDTLFGHPPSTRCVSFLTCALRAFSTLTLSCVSLLTNKNNLEL